MAIANGENDMDKNEVLKILETAKDENGEVPMRLVRQAFEKLPESCEDTISRQAAIDALGERPMVLTGGDYELGKQEQYVRDLLAIENVPSAQPEIIRCKNCRYYQDNNDGYPHINCKWDANETPDADDFCSGAERRTDEE